MAFDPSAKGVAYLVVGSTGTGKSSLISLFTDGKPHVAGGVQAGTTEIHSYLHKNKRDILIDTVGIEDPNGKSDEQIMCETLGYLQNDSIKDVVVVWTVKCDVRKNQALQKQAKYINSFSSGKIWDSTIIVVKQGVFLEEDAQGAIEAAHQYYSGDIAAITYTCVDWFSEKKRAHYESMRKCMSGLLSEKEVIELIEETLVKLPKPSCQVIFEDSECIKCGVIGDKRLMPEKCHLAPTMHHCGKLDKQRNHTGSRIETVTNVFVDKYHTGEVVWFHPGVVIVSKSHTYFGPFEWNHKKTKRYDCCGRWDGSDGCESKYDCCGANESSAGCKRERVETKKILMSCCNLPPGSQCGSVKDVWTCCKKDADNEGCQKICVKCKKPWNNGEFPGCTSIQVANHHCGI